MADAPSSQEPPAAERRPVILAIDDDPVVLAAVARDLRRGFGERFRIMRAPSGAEALELLRQLRTRGDQVALLIADQRMPGMPGTEFLTQARKVVPDAKRVLLLPDTPWGAMSFHPRLPQIITGESDAAVWTTADGSTWTRVDDPDLTGPGDQFMIYAIQTQSGLIAVGSDDRSGDDDGAVWVSEDGTDWVQLSDPTFGGLGDQVIRGLACQDGTIIAVGRESGDLALWKGEGVTC
jgi:CheY-like chemotaxis protein